MQGLNIFKSLPRELRHFIALKFCQSGRGAVTEIGGDGCGRCCAAQLSGRSRESFSRCCDKAEKPTLLTLPRSPSASHPQALTLPPSSLLGHFSPSGEQPRLQLLVALCEPWRLGVPESCNSGRARFPRTAAPDGWRAGSGSRPAAADSSPTAAIATWWKLSDGGRWRWRWRWSLFVAPGVSAWAELLLMAEASVAGRLMDSDRWRCSALAGVHGVVMGMK